MARERGTNSENYGRPIRRILVGMLVLFFLAVLLVWRIDSPRMERFRARVTDQVLPNAEWAMAPVTALTDMVANFQSYQRIYEQNQELRRELQQMKAWKEAALQLEQKNARLLELNNVRLDPQLTWVTGVVTADSGSPFRQSVVLNVGARDGITDGWATMDGMGLAGRISGVGERTSRVILLTDSNSHIPVSIQPSGQRALLAGDNTAVPPLEFLDNPDLVEPGDRVVSSGDGGVFPPGILVGQITESPGGRLRVRLAADYERLEFLRVLRVRETPPLTHEGNLLTGGVPRVPGDPAGPEQTGVSGQTGVETPAATTETAAPPTGAGADD